MSSCPLCNRNYEDETLRFCLDDGTLLRSSSWSEFPATVNMSSHEAENATTVTSLTAPPFTPTAKETQEVGKTVRSAVPVTADNARRNPVPWVVLGIILGVFAIVVVIALIGIQSSLRANKEVESEQASPLKDSAAEPLPDSKEETASISRVPSESSASIEQSPKTQDSARTPPTEQTTKSPDSGRTPPPKPSPAGPQVKESTTKRTIAGGVLNGRAISLPKPPYPAIAQKVKASGAVLVQVTVDENGDVISAKAVSGHPLLQGVSVAAARQAKFSPTLLSGQPVRVTGVITYNFVSAEN